MDHNGEISGEVHSPPPEATWGGGPGGVQTQRVAGPGTLGWSPWMECFGVPGLNLDQSFQTPHSRVFASSKGVLFKGHRRRSWEAGKT